MQCTNCGYENQASAASCVKCATPFPGSDLTLAGSTETTPSSSFTQAPSAAPSSATPAVIEVGSVVGNRFEILQLLGEGGMGAVYKAHDRELERNVALKLIRTELARNPEILQRFKQEIILARQITHRNVIRIFDIGQADGHKYITMEYLEGRDLRAVLREKGKLPPEEAAKIVLQICRALEAAHGEGVIHRDLKPQNIMLDANGRAYVMDFGIARSAYLPGMTQTGALVGTPEYMSPEQAKGEKLDERSDLFSLGVILYELLTGTSPYHSDTPLATLWRRIQEKAKPLSEVDPTIPKPLSDIVAKALEIDPGNRFASAAEFAQNLESWLGISPSMAGSTTYQALVVPQPVRPIWKYTAIVATVLLIGVAALGLPKKFLSTPSKKIAHDPVGVLVADFTNHTGDPVFDDTLEPMFNVALEGASFINAFNRGNARKLAAQLPHPSDKLDEQPARLVAVSQGVGAVVTGELSRRGDQYSLSATALDSQTGNVIAKAEATAATKDEVLLTIPKLAAPIRKALGDSTSESAQLQAAGGAFTAASLEAVHEYGVAMNQQFAGNFEAALQSFTKAAQLDPNFARAYAGQAAVAGNLGQYQDAEKYAKLAMAHVDRMTERERFRIRGMYYIRTENWQKCIEEYSDLLKQYPADNIAHNNMAACYAGLRDMPKAVEEARRAVEIAPKDLLARNNYSLYACYTGDFQTCEREGREVRKLNPSSEDGFLLLGYSQIGQGQLDKATETYQELQKLGPRGVSLAASALANIALYEGRYRAAQKILENAIKVDLSEKQPDRAADNLALLATTALSRGDKAGAISAAQRALSSSQSEKIKFLAARSYVEAGEAGKARELAAVLGGQLQSEPQAYAKIILAEIALTAHDAKQAIQLLTDAQNLVDIWIVHLDLGRAYLEAGAVAEADGEFDRCIKRRGEVLELFSDDMPTYSYLPPVYYFQGRARDGLKSSGAVDSYKAYLDIRGAAGEDPLLPEVRRLVTK
jgi:serine/threonine protein kinase/tetratricopeptide (TPR) repeat protein